MKTTAFDSSVATAVENAVIEAYNCKRVIFFNLKIVKKKRRLFLFYIIGINMIGM